MRRPVQAARISICRGRSSARFGTRIDSTPSFIEASMELVSNSLVSEKLRTSAMPPPGRARTRRRATIREAIAPRLAAPDESERSLLASLASAHPRLLDDIEIGSNALIVLFGGIETTEGLIANALWAMFRHPEALARARASDDDLERCIEESLRWEPAVQTCTRYAAESGVLQGVKIPRGSVVQCMIGAMNRDPAHFAAADRYDPWRRESLGYAACGFGRHFCLGAALARVEARVAIRRLFDAFLRLQFDAGRSTPPRGHEFRKVGALMATLS